MPGGTSCGSPIEEKTHPHPAYWKIKEPQATSHGPCKPTMPSFLGMRKRFQKRERSTLHSRAPGLTPPLVLDTLLRGLGRTGRSWGFEPSGGRAGIWGLELDGAGDGCGA
jgi:hypothetical protein